MSTWHLTFDADRCNNCNNCILAVKDEYVGNAFPGYSAPMPAHGTLWLTVRRKERGAQPMVDVSHYVETCMNCREPACVNAETAGVVTQREDGIVLIDPEKAKGRRDIVGMCPYGQIFWNEALQIPQKWTWDAHLLDAGWKEPRPAQVCPTGALTAGKADDAEMDRRTESGELSVMQPDRGTGPRFYVRNFGRVESSFLGGTVFSVNDALEDCAEGVAVSLRRDGTELASTTTDAFGDFKFDALPGQGERYVLRVDAGGDPVDRDVELTASTYVGAIEIPPR